MAIPTFDEFLAGEKSQAKQQPKSKKGGIPTFDEFLSTQQGESKPATQGMGDLRQTEVSLPKPSLASRVVGTVERFSEASKDPFSKMGERAGQFTAEKIGQLFGVTPEQTQARQDILNAPKQRRMESVSPTTKAVADTAGNIAGSLVGLGMAGKVATPAVKALDKFGRPLLTNIAGQAATGAIYEGANAIGNGGGPVDALKKTAEGALLFGAAGPLGSVVGKGVKAILPGAVGHYTGNLARGATMGAGFSYGGNLLEGQPLDGGEAAKNAAIFGALDLMLGGKAKINRPTPEVVPEVTKPEPQRVPDSEAWTVDNLGVARAPQGPVALLPAGPSFKTNKYTMQPFIQKQAEQAKKAAELPIEARSYEDVANKSVKAYQYEHPELRPFYQEEAYELLGELESSVKGQRFFNEGQSGERIITGQKKFVSDSVARIQEETGASYKEIENALTRIIKDHGKENTVLAKKIELIIDDNLSMGKKAFDGYDVPANDAYVAAREAVKTKPMTLRPTDKIPTTSEYLGSTKRSSNLPALTKPERLGYYGVQNGAVMQNKGLTRSLPTIPTDRGVKLAPQLPKAEALPNLLPKLPKANAGANGGQVNTIDKIVSGKQANSTSLWEKINNLYTRTVDTQRPIGRFSKEAKAEGLTPAILASNSRNAPGITSHIFENGLVNREGQKIGESYKELLRSIPKDGEKEVADYLLHKHNVARMAQGKPVFGNDVTADVSMAKVAEYEALHPEYKQLGDRLNNFIDSTMKAWGVDSGLLTKEQYAAMKQMYPDYVPTFRSFSELEKAPGLTSPNTGRGKSFVGRTAGIKSATGSERPVIDPLESIMGLVDKTVKAAKYNEVGQSIVNAVKENPEGLKRWAEIIPTKQGLLDDINKVLQEEGMEGVVAKFNEQFDRAFNKTSLDKDNIVRVMVEGKPVYLQINDKSFLDAVKGLTQSDTGAIEKAFRKGTGVFKALITGKNPLFAIKNIARDIPTSYVNGSEKNPAKFLVDLLAAGKDIVTKNAQFQEYRALGGGQGNFFAQDTNLLKSGGSLPGKIVGKIEAFNNLTESVPRYAEYKRTAKLGGGDYAAKQQGIFNANEVTTNFGRHGDLTKSVDSFVPYLNPAVQGIDKTIRQFKNHPIATILKGATIVTAPTLILSHANKDNPNYKALDNRTKDNYFLIPNNSDKDENGNAKTFFKLPKSRELGVLFGSLTERTLRATAGEGESFKGYGNTVATNFSPSNPIESNIFSPLAYNIPKNKDFANRTIVPQSMQDRSPRYQYDDQTSEIAKKIGDITNMSPKQIDYLISSYTGVIGQFVLPATTKSNYQSGNTLQKGLRPITKQFTADPLYSNGTINDFYDNYDKLKQLAADKNFVESVPSKAVTPEERLRNAYLKASKEMSALTKQIKEEDIAGNPEEVKRLRRQIIDIAGRTNQLMPK